ncbi:Putative ankyrin repeat protein RF_0922 [Durusdinium trenchii]|uniref:Ankyrin repeat protein RF_0922 n=1 Tax=Durusdinium trenchii TaxID=1381693 RepID=A0ABP0LBA9_9DINO
MCLNEMHESCMSCMQVSCSKAPLPALREEDVANSYALLEAGVLQVQHPNFRHVNQKTKEGRTALHLVMLKKLPEDLCLAIAKHKDFNEVNAVDTFGYTQLILAASKGMSQVCKAILDRDDFVGINAQDKWGATALHWAADQDLAEVCEKILSHPEFVEGNRRAWSFAFEDKTALDVALNRNCKAAAEVIRKHVGPR